MSYDVAFLNKEGNFCRVDTKHYLRGGTYALGGTDILELNVTYNYSPFFHGVLGKDGLRTIHGVTAEKLIPILEQLILEYGPGTEPDEDYWMPTMGNVVQCMRDLLTLAKLAPPDSVLDVD